MRPRRNRRLLPCGLILAALIAGACGGQVDERDAPLVQFDSPTPRPPRPAVATLAPGATPTPKPTPVPTPVPVPVLALPRSTSLRAEAGSQMGSPSGYCWTSGSQSTCPRLPPPHQPSALPVKRGEAVLLVIDADRPPDSESIRPFQGARGSYPTQAVDPARETTLTIDLEPGEWQVDLCAAWTGHGQPCWLFRLQVA